MAPTPLAVLSGKFPITPPPPGIGPELALKLANCGSAIGSGPKKTDPNVFVGVGPETSWNWAEGNATRVNRLKMKLPAGSPWSDTSISTFCPTVSDVRLFGDDNTTRLALAGDVAKASPQCITMRKIHWRIMSS